MKYAISFLVAILLAASSFFFGNWYSNQHLPSCQEDEFLYPEDFTGPGKNVISDYDCKVIDDVFSL